MKNKIVTYARQPLAREIQALVYGDVLLDEAFVIRDSANSDEVISLLVERQHLIHQEWGTPGENGDCLQVLIIDLSLPDAITLLTGALETGKPTVSIGSGAQDRSFGEAFGTFIERSKLNSELREYLTQFLDGTLLEWKQHQHAS